MPDFGATNFCPSKPPPLLSKTVGNFKFPKEIWGKFLSSSAAKFNPSGDVSNNSALQLIHIFPPWSPTTIEPLITSRCVVSPWFIFKLQTCVKLVNLFLFWSSNLNIFLLFFHTFIFKKSSVLRARHEK